MGYSQACFSEVKIGNFGQFPKKWQMSNSCYLERLRNSFRIAFQKESKVDLTVLEETKKSLRAIQEESL